MKVSELFFSTLRETPAEAEVVSHQLMMRAGMIRKVTSGVYSYMPLAYRVLKKIMNIVRDEMDKAGGQEVMLPIIQPSEIWQQSGRWEVYGDEMWRLHDRHGRDFCLGPTHEEVITDLVKGEVKSYKQLPLRLYQIQNKYRDERRPRFGLMRGREFIMKDLYSFDRDEAGLDICYQDMYQAYNRIFSRCGLEFRPVQADTGAIGGNASHEFMVLAESGEAEVVYCDSCNYAANVEIAPAHPEIISDEEQMVALEEVHTPNIKTIEEVTKFLNVPANKLIKTLCYQADEELIVVLIRGDRKVNEIKLKNTLGCVLLELASDNEVKRVMGASPGSVGPIGLKGIKIIADYEVSGMVNAVCGANKDDYHTKNVNPGRDFEINIENDIRLVETGERCPECEGKLLSARGIEVGQVFKLQTKYSNAMGAKYLDDNGQEQLMVMGCYGIGVSRTMAAAIEQNHDENGIIWPMSIAPYQVMVVPVSVKDETQTKVAETIYQGLLQDGVEVLYDDRNERPGVKFKDADLIGFPIRITVGAKTLAEGKVEIKLRSTGEVSMVEVEEAINFVKSLINNK